MGCAIRKRSAVLTLLALSWWNSTESYFFNGIKSGLEADLRNSLFLDRIGQCRWMRALPVQLSNMRIVQYNNTHYVASGVFTVLKDIAGDISAIVSIEICSNDTVCRPYIPPVRLNRFCELLRTSTNTTWGKILNHSVTPLRCPFRTGLYRLNDAMIDYTPFRYFSPYVSNIWRIQVAGEWNERRVFCVLVEISVYSWEDMLPRYDYD